MFDSECAEFEALNVDRSVNDFVFDLVRYEEWSWEGFF